MVVLRDLRFCLMKEVRPWTPIWLRFGVDGGKMESKTESLVDKSVPVPGCHPQIIPSFRSNDHHSFIAWRLD